MKTISQNYLEQIFVWKVKPMWMLTKLYLQKLLRVWMYEESNSAPADFLNYFITTYYFQTPPFAPVAK